CGIPDVQEDRTSVRNISLNQERNVASPFVNSLMSVKIGLLQKTFPHSEQEYGFSPDRNTASAPCAISDVCKDGNLQKNISRTQNRNMAFPQCEISDVCKDGTSLKNISHTEDKNVACPQYAISYVCKD
ncbi:unnamed protein product, partial [Staurois parvus]